MEKQKEEKKTSLGGDKEKKGKIQHIYKSLGPCKLLL